MTLEEFYKLHGSKISQDSERLFVDEFLYPMLGSKISHIEPQYSFVDRTGKNRRIDFAYHGENNKIALEVNGETYHAEGIIPDEQFDDNLFRQNEILRKGYKLIRYSYSQLKSPKWRPVVADSLRNLFADYAPSLLTEYSLEPNQIQVEALEALAHARETRKWSKGVVVLPTGTGKTILSAMDAKRHGGRVLFLVHRLDILSQSIDAYRKVWGNLKDGILTGDERLNELNCDVLFASKDTLRQPDELSKFGQDWFDYIVVDEVHHGQSPSYEALLRYFRPKFMLGMTATPDRTDRKDIFELFDYNKVYEIPLSEVIERGLLVPYTYIGLTDNIDYSKIRYENQRYKVDDLERFLIIPERNNAILEAYLDTQKGSGDKAIGFCISIKHAERMAEFFCSKGIKAAAVHSERADRYEIIKQFRADNLQIVFTVDLFNEGVDFPNVQVLLFLRPTESKTVFLQQLGRGLRICAGKERVRILDFIGNYKRANQIRKYLSKSSFREDGLDENGKRIKKIVYEYATGCEVQFSSEVEEILNRQDLAEIGIDKQDLLEAYYFLAEKLEHKPSKQDLDEHGEYPSRLYIQAWGTWLGFLREIGEYTEASYHYPQGTHLGHVLSILWYFGLPSRDGTHLDDKYIRMRGGLGEARTGTYQRQLKYKLQAAMELGILEDDRQANSRDGQHLSLTAVGIKLRNSISQGLKQLNLEFPLDEEGFPSSRMAENEEFYNAFIKQCIDSSSEARQLFYSVFLKMPAVIQMIKFLYQIERSPSVQKNKIYEDFFKTPFVKRFCEQEGIEEATLEAAKRRCPFLLNILEACGAIKIGRSEVSIVKMLLNDVLVMPHDKEEASIAKTRLDNLRKAWPSNVSTMPGEDISILKELFGSSFLTEDFYIKQLETVEV